MSEIQYMEKPDWVPWKDVCDCIHKANTVNDKKGFHMRFAKIEPDEIKKELEDGHCFVAIKDKRVIGTASFRIRNLRKLYVWGKVIYYSLDGILPEFRGTDVYFNLTELREKYVKKTGIKIFQFHTAEKNKTVIKLNQKYGYKLVLFKPTAGGTDYYSVTMVKWENGCPLPDWYLGFMFKISRFVTKAFFTPDFKFKYWFH